MIPNIVFEQFQRRTPSKVNWGLGADTNASSNIKSYITYVSQVGFEEP